MTLRTAQFEVDLLIDADPDPAVGLMTFDTDSMLDMVIEVEALTLARSAPDLLAALEALLAEILDVLGDLNVNPSDPLEGQPVIKQARAAIAKARPQATSPYLNRPLRTVEQAVRDSET